MAEQIRVDKWLWSVRLYKTRTAAGDACSTGKVRIDGEPAKSARRVSAGNVITVRRRGYTNTYRVEKVIEKRVGADIAATCYTDLTPDDEKPKPRSSAERVDAAWAERSRGAGRPTKRDRRQMEKMFGNPKKSKRR